jgi:ABC-type amino acid transport substrate-binding protein
MEGLAVIDQHDSAEHPTALKHNESNGYEVFLPNQLPRCFCHQRDASRADRKRDHLRRATNRMTERTVRVGIDDAPPAPVQLGHPDKGDFRGYEVELLKEVGRRLTSNDFLGGRG